MQQVQHARTECDKSAKSLTDKNSLADKNLASKTVKTVAILKGSITDKKFALKIIKLVDMLNRFTY